MLLVPVGVIVPLSVFYMSAMLMPEWKGASRLGWVGCFVMGKIALSPLVLWACAAWYAVECRQVVDRTKRWIVLGFFMGSVTSSVCVLQGVICSLEPGIGILVPLYVAVWHTFRAVQLCKAAALRLKEYLWTLASSIPFWVWAVIWSRREFQALPDKPPDCFVVTAAMRGHSDVVGPFFEVEHRDQRRQANQQLLTLWQFETYWRTQAPRIHACFRRGYNVIGPKVARRITSPWAADVMYLLLKPTEFLARMVLILLKSSTA